MRNFAERELTRLYSSTDCSDAGVRERTPGFILVGASI
jgi:hypothetical protein